MKKRFGYALLIICCLLLVSYFITSVQQKELSIDNTLPNVIAAVNEGKNWTKWNESVKNVWLHDSSKCQFADDATKHIATIQLPDKKISITQLNNLSYQIEQTTGNSSDYFVLTIFPGIPKNKMVTENTSKIAYAWNSNWFYKIFPFFAGSSLCEKTVNELVAYLNNPKRFYGLDINLTPTSDVLFITRKTSIPKSDVFKTLPVMFDSLDAFCKENHLKHQNRNVYYEPLPGDSLQVLAGVNIDTAYIVEGVNQFMQLPAAQTAATGMYKGPFSKRQAAYSAMNKFLFDKELVKGAVRFETYISPLPIADTSTIEIKLTYPIRSMN